jgi:hypothetical protein
MSVVVARDEEVGWVLFGWLIIIMFSIIKSSLSSSQEMSGETSQNSCPYLDSPEPVRALSVLQQTEGDLVVWITQSLLVNYL